MDQSGILKLYLIERVNDECDYDEWESAVVAAYSEDEAKHIYPAGGTWDAKNDKWVLAPELRREWNDDPKEWVRPELVKATMIGYAHGDINAGSVVHNSFRNG
jgi:hypothetical protein